MGTFEVLLNLLGAAFLVHPAAAPPKDAAVAPAPAVVDAAAVPACCGCCSHPPPVASFEIEWGTFVVPSYVTYARPPSFFFFLAKKYFFLLSLVLAPAPRRSTLLRFGA
jgi:hypothetical protein